MISNVTLDKLRELRLQGMSQALEEQLAGDDFAEMTFEERFGLLVDRETTYRDNRRLQTRIKKAKLSPMACMEDVNYRHRRGLDRSVMKTLGTCQWIRERLHVLITGPTGVGKTFLAQALAHRACVNGFSALQYRVPRLFRDLAVARGDGRYPRLMNAIAKASVLILDDWGLAPLEDNDRLELLEILEERQGRGSLVVTSQLPVGKWHDAVGNATLADAILDRIVHGAYRLELDGESMRKANAGSKK